MDKQVIDCLFVMDYSLSKRTKAIFEMKSEINKTKSAAIAAIQNIKNERKIPKVANDLKMDVSWFYKVADGSITPSYERSLMVLDYLDAA